ncbi:MAG: hypothetical protein IKK75_13705 [Clostridia bacterium]|nr:hypothetical protein [Clostridia bacterium]
MQQVNPMILPFATVFCQLHDSLNTTGADLAARPTAEVIDLLLNYLSEQEKHFTGRKNGMK